MKTFLLIFLLISSDSAFAQKSGSRQKAKEQTRRKYRRADIFGDCMILHVVEYLDGTLDTIAMHNVNRPDCFGEKIKIPNYRKTGKRNIPEKGKYHPRKPKRKPATQMMTKAHDRSNQKAFADRWMIRMISQRGPTFSRSSDSYIDFGVMTNSLMLKSPP